MARQVKGRGNTMTLSQYLSQQDLTHEAFAALIGVNPSTAWRYANGKRQPRRAIMRRIVKVTAGAVGPQDFLDQDAEGEAA